MVRGPGIADPALFREVYWKWNMHLFKCHMCLLVWMEIRIDYILLKLKSSMHASMYKCTYMYVEYLTSYSTGLSKDDLSE